MEHPPQLNIIQSELAPRVADYFDNLLAQRDVILASYHLTPETAEQFCNLQSTDADREKMLELYENIVYVIAHKQIPPNEKLRQLEIVRSQEQNRIDNFFGKETHIEVPPLPPAITPERIEQWKQKHFELRYLPPLTLNEGDNYPGWNDKPNGMKFDFWHRMDDIKKVKKNLENSHLANLESNQLSGNWILVDMHEKPHAQSERNLPRYANDRGIESMLKKFFCEGTGYYREYFDLFNGRRFGIFPETFDDPRFWKLFYHYLGINPSDDAIIRLPRIIEQSVLYQDEVNKGLDTFEWVEERWDPFRRFFFGDNQMGVENLNYGRHDIGFRPVVIFASHDAR